jgi:hypothetical protein
MSETSDLALTRAELRVIKAGREAWHELKETAKRTWPDYWRKIGLALLVGREWAIKASGADGPHGAAYASVFNEWVSQNGFTDLEGKAQANLLTLVAEVEIVDAEWKALGKLDERLRANHPTRLLAVVRKKHPEKFPGGAKKRRKKAAAKEDEATIADLEEEITTRDDRIADLEEELGKPLVRDSSASVARDWLFERWGGTGHDLVLSVYEGMTPGERKALLAALRERDKSKLN